MSIIDLSQVPAPEVVKQLSYETILSEIKADLLLRDPTLADVLALESEPIIKVLQACAYRELQVRQDANDAAHAVMLAYAAGADLEQLGANRETLRLAGESDPAFRSRVQKAFNKLAAAGPDDAFIQHALGVDASIIDVSATSLSDGQVTITVLAPDYIDTASATVLQVQQGAAAFPTAAAPDGQVAIVAGDGATTIVAVRDHLMQPTIKPLTDVLIVRGPTVKTFSIDAALTVYPGFDQGTVLAAAHAQLDVWLAEIRHMDYDANRSGIIGALSVTGVQNIALTLPAVDVVTDKLEIALSTSVTVIVGGTDV